jgi:ATP-dependent DNA ligase
MIQVFVGVLKYFLFDLLKLTGRQLATCFHEERQTALIALLVRVFTARH